MYNAGSRFLSMKALICFEECEFVCMLSLTFKICFRCGASILELSPQTSLLPSLVVYFKAACLSSTMLMITRIWLNTSWYCNDKAVLHS